MNPVHLFRTAILAGILTCASAHAAEPFLKKGDVIALVGGEDMVAASEYGYLELLLQRALPDFRLQFRSLAWEGDTVFEQRRDLNFPPLEAQLEQIGATVVLCQFGQMESIAGKPPEFSSAYEKLIERIRGGGKRRVVIVFPAAATSNAQLSGERSVRRDELELMNGQIEVVVQTSESAAARLGAYLGIIARLEAPMFRDGVHLSEAGQEMAAWDIAFELVPDWRRSYMPTILKGTSHLNETESVALVRETQRRDSAPLRAAIIAKNRLWFDYWRPQNWAFLAGDRTSQPSSRDHLDPTKRWFPAEREAFLPLIAAKEEEIWKLAATLK